MLSSLGLNIQPLLASLGAGGLITAYALQGLLTNMGGAITLVRDRVKVIVLQCGQGMKQAPD